MKKQGALYLKLLSISLAGLMILFLLLSLRDGKEGAYRLQEVIYCEVGDGFPVSGFVVREEQLLFSRQTPLTYSAGEGQWLSSGSCYAVRYCCARAAEAQLPPDAVLCVSQSGYFSREADGFTGVFSPEKLQTLSVAEFSSLLGIRLAVPEGCAGRLISGQTWYFAALIPEGTGYAPGNRLSIRFDALGQEAFEMTLCHLSPAQKGRQLAVFSCRQGLQAVLSCRRLEGRAQTALLTGLKIPKEALYHLDGETGVYVLVGQQAKWREITILKELGEAVLVQDAPGDRNSLRKEDVLILTTEEIENGKVIS